MTLGKGIGGGVPLAALLATNKASCFEHGDQGGTFNGNPLMCAAGLAVLAEVGKPEFPEIGRRCRPVPGKRAAADFGAARSRRSPRPRAAAGARPQASDRRLDRRTGAGRRPAAQLAAAGRAALHAGAQRHAGGDRRDDRRPRRDPDADGRGKAGGVSLSKPGVIRASDDSPRSNPAFALFKLDCFVASAPAMTAARPTASRSTHPWSRGLPARYAPSPHPSARRRG